jgi:magnesium transporter
VIEELLEIEALKIKLLIQEEDDRTLKAVLDELHEADIAQILDNLNEEQRQYVIHLLEIETAASVISEMDAESHPEELISNLDTSLAASIIGEMETDDATDLISLLTEEAQDRVLNQVDKEDAADIRQLMEYSEDTAGGIMNTDLISVPSYFSKKEAVEEVIRQSEEVENFYYVYIIDRQDILVGILSLKDLIRAKPFMIMDEIMEKDIITINVHEDQEEVARVIRKYNLPSLPVVDDE